MDARERLQYVVVRYYYDRVRDEAVNIGVLVQTADGLKLRTVAEWEEVRRAYPFIDPKDLQRQADFLKALIGRDRIRVFDYEKNASVEVEPRDPRLFSLLTRGLAEQLGFSEARVAELNTERPGGTEPPHEALLGHLYQTFVEPPRPLRIEGGGAGAAAPRRAHTTLRRAAVKIIVRRAREAGLDKDALEIDPAVKGHTREWHLDVRIPRANYFLQHILVLPELEETYREAAALARIWQDVRRERQAGQLTAVFYSQNGIPRGKLRAGEELLAADNITAVYAPELPKFYRELVGQRRLWSRD